MNKKRQTSHLFLLSAIVIIGATSLSAGQIFQQGTAQVSKPNTAGVANQTAANIPYLPPGLMQSIIDQARNTNATKFAFHNAINATTAALKTAGMNATGAAGMNKTAGTNATGAVNSVMKLVQNTNATKFAAHNIINATENTSSKH